MTPRLTLRIQIDVHRFRCVEQPMAGQFSEHCNRRAPLGGYLLHLNRDTHTLPGCQFWYANGDRAVWPPTAASCAVRAMASLLIGTVSAGGSIRP